MALAVLFCNTKHANAEEVQEQNQPKSSQSIDIESFKQSLESITKEESFVKEDGFQEVAETQKAGVQMLGSTYRLAPGDSINVSVYGEPDLTQTDILIRHDGNATIEPFGELKVAGMTVNDLIETLQQRYKTYLLDPKVSVKVSHYKIPKVYVYGAVNKPGLYQHTAVTTTDPVTGRTITSMPDLTVSNVIANSGGIKHHSDISRIKITNSHSGTSRIVDLSKMIRYGDTSQDVILSDGDTVYVPYFPSSAQIPDDQFMLMASSTLSPATFRVKVLGEVVRPGDYEITGQNPSILAAIAAAEGFGRDANRKMVQIQRVTPQGNIATIYVDPNRQHLMLRPNDIVYVDVQNSGFLARKAGPVADIIRPFGIFADSYNSWAEMFNPTRRYDFMRR